MLTWLSDLAKAGGTIAQREIGRIAVTIGLLALAGILALVALGFITAGIYTAIRNELGPVSALFIMAGIFIAMAVIAALVGSRRGRQKRPRRRVIIEEEIDPGLPPGSQNEKLASLGTVAGAFAFGLARGFVRRRRS